MVWKPHVTVAAVIEQDQKFLMVREYDGQDIVLNQPAGHLEPEETLLDAVKREVLEETGWLFEPQSIIGVYPLGPPDADTHYLRFCFMGAVSDRVSNTIDDEIIEAIWLTTEEIKLHKVRSRLVEAAINDYINGQHYSLDLVKET